MSGERLIEDDRLYELKRKAYDTEADAEMSLRAEGGPFQLLDEPEEGGTLRVDDIGEDYLALAGFKQVDTGEFAAYFRMDLEEARELAAALNAAVDLCEEVDN